MLVKLYCSLSAEEERIFLTTGVSAQNGSLARLLAKKRFCPLKSVKYGIWS